VIGLLEIRRRKLQFALITLIVTLISYLVLMINGLGVGLNDSAGSALRNFDASAIAYSDRAGISVIRSELSQEQVDAIAAHRLSSGQLRG
jgi:putative ABC transport system permease protein